MKNEQKLNINEAANLYIQSGRDEAFTDLYERAKRYYFDKLNYWSTYTTFASEHEITGIFHDALWDAVEEIKRSGGNFFALFTVKLHGMYKSLLRKVVTKRKYEQYEYSRGNNKENTAMFETIADEFDLEEHVTKKKEADQRELIDFLADPEQVNDETTTAIVESFITNDGPTTPTAIGKKLGLHHSTVIRKLERLAKRFDERQFGNYRDYLLAQ